MSGPQSFSWLGLVSKDWNTAANWYDITSGQSGVAIPGSLDTAIFSGFAAGTITGSALVDTLQLNSQSTLDLAGTINTGTLAVGAGFVTIDAGATVHAASATIATFNGVTLGPTTATLLIDNTLTLGGTSGGVLASSLGGYLQSGNVVLNAGTLGGITDRSYLVNLTYYTEGYDPILGAIEIGHLGSVAGGQITIDPGFSVSGDGQLTGSVINNGAIIVSGTMTIGTKQTLVQISPGRRIETSSVPDSYGGSGTIEVEAGSSLTFLAMGAGHFKLDGGATLLIQGGITAGSTINLSGSGNVISWGGGLSSGETIDSYGTNVTTSWGGGLNGGETPMNAVLVGFNASDTLSIEETGTRFVVNSASLIDNQLHLKNGTTDIDVITLAGDYSHYQPQVTQQLASGDTYDLITLVPIPCFAAGTRVATSRGLVAVERLRVGDNVLTLSGKPQCIQWIGRRTLDCRRHAQPGRVYPVHIAPHAFGQDRPKREVVVSPDHSLYLAGGLLPVRHLLNGTTVRQEPAGLITYFHIELPRHDILLAEGLPVESYLETGSRHAFENAGLPLQLHPDFTADEAYVGMIWRNFSYAPLITDPATVAMLRNQLAVQAAMLRAANRRKPQRRVA